MRRISILLPAILIIFAGSLIALSSARAPQGGEHTEWVGRSLREMETIEVGMTRAERLKVFVGEGGLSTRKQRQYAYRECLYIKVKVEFEPVGKPAGPGFESPEDKITKISKPFLEWPILD